MAYYFSAPVMKLLFVGLLFGVSNSLSSGLVQSLVANHAPKSKGNTVLSLLRTVQDVGPLVGSLFSGVLLDGLGFGATSVLFGLLALPTVSWRGFLCLRRSSARRWGNVQPVVNAASKLSSGADDAVVAVPEMGCPKLV